MPLYDVQTSYAHLIGGDWLTGGATWANEGISDEQIDLDTLPTEAEVLADLVALRATCDDGDGVSYRRVFFAQDDAGDFTVLALDVSLPAD